MQRKPGRILQEHPVNNARQRQASGRDADLALGPGTCTPSADLRQSLRQERGDYQRRRSGARRRRAARLGRGSTCPAPRAISTPTTPPRAVTPWRPCRTTTWCASTSRPRMKPSHEGRADAKVEALERIDRAHRGAVAGGFAAPWRSGACWSRPTIARTLRTRAHAYGLVTLRTGRHRGRTRWTTELRRGRGGAERPGFREGA